MTSRNRYATNSLPHQTKPVFVLIEWDKDELLNSPRRAEFSWTRDAAKSMNFPVTRKVVRSRGTGRFQPGPISRPKIGLNRIAVDYHKSGYSLCYKGYTSLNNGSSGFCVGDFRWIS
jgi:hypothetical protein